MSKELLEELRDKINLMIISEDIDGEELLRASQEMDVLIVEYLREKGLTKKVIQTVNLLSKYERI